MLYENFKAHFREHAKELKLLEPLKPHWEWERFEIQKDRDINDEYIRFLKQLSDNVISRDESEKLINSFTRLNESLKILLRDHELQTASYQENYADKINNYMASINQEIIKHKDTHGKISRRSFLKTGIAAALGTAIFGIKPKIAEAASQSGLINPLKDIQLGAFSDESTANSAVEQFKIRFNQVGLNELTSYIMTYKVNSGKIIVIVNLNAPIQAATYISNVIKNQKIDCFVIPSMKYFTGNDYILNQKIVLPIEDGSIYNLIKKYLRGYSRENISTYYNQLAADKRKLFLDMPLRWIKPFYLADSKYYKIITIGKEYGTIYDIAQQITYETDYENQLAEVLEVNGIASDEVGTIGTETTLAIPLTRIKLTKEYEIINREEEEEKEKRIPDPVVIVDTNYSKYIRKKYLGVLRGKHPSVLVESGFVTSPVDYKYMSSINGRREFGRAVCKGIVNHAKKTGKRTIIVAIGHGLTKNDPGAIGKVNGNTIKETDVNTDVANELVFRLEREGLKAVKYTYTGSASVRKRINSTVAFKSKYSNALFVEIHSNSSNDSSANGSEVYVDAKGTQRLSRAFATDVLQGIHQSGFRIR